MKAIVTGMIASYPVGGVAWDYGQYLLGLRELGFDVYYLEDTGSPIYDPAAGLYGEDASSAAHFLAAALEQIVPGIGTNWHLRSEGGQTYGMSPEALTQVIAECDVFLNVSGGTLLRPEYMHARRKVLIDTDPGWNQFVNYPKWDANPGWLGTLGYRAHDYFFTYAARIGSGDCPLPSLGISWVATRPPVVPGCWAAKPPGEAWTTVMTWDNFRRPVEYSGAVYGSKELEFVRIETLPGQVEFPLEVAAGGKHAPRERWRQLGWSVVDSHTVSATVDAYRGYICSSRGEFSVAKNLYTATRSGWFSCRTVCYLAAGLPVVVQDTGFSEFLPVGEGLLVFSDLAGAAEGLRRVERDYAGHQEAAREIALAHFDAKIVLAELLGRIGLD